MLGCCLAKLGLQDEAAVLHIALACTQALQHFGVLAIGLAQLQGLRLEAAVHRHKHHGLVAVDLLDGRTGHRHRRLLAGCRQIHIHEEARTPDAIRVVQGDACRCRAGFLPYQGAHIGYRPRGFRFKGRRMHSGLFAHAHKGQVAGGHLHFSPDRTQIGDGEHGRAVLHGLAHGKMLFHHHPIEGRAQLEAVQRPGSA